MSKEEAIGYIVILIFVIAIAVLFLIQVAESEETLSSLLLLKK